MITQVDFIFAIAVLIMSVVVHEVSHGYAAESLGDPTAKLAGRLTLNPLKHLDMVGSFIVPVLSWFAGGFIFGWAKPVPYNPYNLKNPRRDEALVAAAGPASNILIALLLGTVIRFGQGGFLNEPAVSLLGLVVFINIILALFNLIPIPPLDGSKILFSILPYSFYNLRFSLERYALIFIFIFIFFLWRFFVPVIFSLFSLITGM